MSRLWNSLVVDNPMLIEISRFRRKFLSVGGSVNGVVLGLAAVCYVGLLALVLNFLGEMPPLVLILIQTGIFCLLAPAMLYASIAGERERRSWDLLLVAPITKAQIVFGKFMGALAALGTGGLLFFVPIFLTGITYRSQNSNLYDLALSEAVSFSFLTMICAFTIFMSARVRRPLMALGIVLGTLAMTLAVLPALFGLLTNGDSIGMGFLLLMHPFVALIEIGEASTRYAGGSGSVMPTTLYGWPHIVTYLLLTVVFLVWAERTLTFAENDVKFLPKGDRNA